MAKNFGAVKVIYKNIPATVPETWLREMEGHAETLGISRNAAFCLAVKMGAPILAAHVATMREVQRSICREVAGRVKNPVGIAGALSEILGSAGKARRRA